MPVLPTVVQRGEQHYVAMRGIVTMDTVGAIADRLPELFAWLGAQGVAPAGAPFFKYNLIDMERQLEMEAGIPLAEPVPMAGDVIAGVLPAGRYATVRHRGHPDELVHVTADLLDWADDLGLRWDMVDTPVGERWGGRLEFYLTDPAVEPDMSRWETELAFKLAD
jgi:effector-binding domain-containing protein